MTASHPAVPAAPVENEGKAEEVLTDALLVHAFRYALKVCRQRGYNTTDPEICSAINAALYRAMLRFDPRRGRFTPMVCRYALHACHQAEERLLYWHRNDDAGARRSIKGPPTPTPIPLADFELISFVAAVGRTKAAKLLCMTPSRLRARLDEVALRLRHQ